MSPKFTAALLFALISGLCLNEANYRRSTGKKVFRAIAIVLQILALLIIAPVP